MKLISVATIPFAFEKTAIDDGLPCCLSSNRPLRLGFRKSRPIAAVGGARRLRRLGTGRLLGHRRHRGALFVHRCRHCGGGGWKTHSMVNSDECRPQIDLSYGHALAAAAGSIVRVGSRSITSMDELADLVESEMRSIIAKAAGHITIGIESPNALVKPAVDGEKTWSSTAAKTLRRRPRRKKAAWTPSNGDDGSTADTISVDSDRPPEPGLSDSSGCDVAARTVDSDLHVLEIVAQLRHALSVLQAAKVPCGRRDRDPRILKLLQGLFAAKQVARGSDNANVDVLQTEAKIKAANFKDDKCWLKTDGANEEIVFPSMVQGKDLAIGAFSTGANSNRADPVFQLTAQDGCDMHWL